MSQPNRKPVDWKGVEADFRAGSMSNRKIAEWYGVSEGAVRKRAKTEGWVRTGTQDAPCEPLEDLIAPHLPKSAPANPADIVGQSLTVVAQLIGELQAVISHGGSIEESIVAFTAGDKDGRRRDAMLKAVALGNRSVIIKNLASAAKILGEVKNPQAAEDDATAALNAAEAADPLAQLLLQ